jgi:hypothetical protein
VGLRAGTRMGPSARPHPRLEDVPGKEPVLPGQPRLRGAGQRLRDDHGLSELVPNALPVRGVLRQSAPDLRRPAAGREARRRPAVGGQHPSDESHRPPGRRVPQAQGHAARPQADDRGGAGHRRGRAAAGGRATRSRCPLHGSGRWPRGATTSSVRRRTPGAPGRPTRRSAVGGRRSRLPGRRGGRPLGRCRRRARRARRTSRAGRSGLFPRPQRRADRLVERAALYP